MNLSIIIKLICDKFKITTSNYIVTKRYHTSHKSPVRKYMIEKFSRKKGRGDFDKHSIYLIRKKILKLKAFEVVSLLLHEMTVSSHISWTIIVIVILYNLILLALKFDSFVLPLLFIQRCACNLIFIIMFFSQNTSSSSHHHPIFFVVPTWMLLLLLNHYIAYTRNHMLLWWLPF